MKWSISAHNTMRRCQRQYLFGHILASPRANDERRREAQVLKQLQSLAAWQGSLVHDGICYFLIPELRARRAVSAEAVIDATLDIARQQFTFSRQHNYRIRGLSKEAAGQRYAALYAHEYDQEISEERLKNVFETVRECFIHLFGQTSLLADIRAHRQLFCEQTFQFTVEQVSIWPKLDLFFFDANNRPVIIDWKVVSDETSDYARQVLVYALSVMRRWPTIQPETITIKAVNLLKNTITLYEVTAERLLDIEDFIYRSTAAVRDLTGDHKAASQSLEDFEPARSVRSCQYCNFRKLCQEVYRDLPSTESLPNYEPEGSQLRLPTL